MKQALAKVNPNKVHADLLAAAAHPTKRRNLGLIQQICDERKKSGIKDFSFKSIGESVESHGGFKAKTLWNPQSADYRTLIEAWEAFAGVPVSTPSVADPVEVLTRNIPDAATRISVERVIRDRHSLRAELNILKSQTKLVIDRRPMHVTQATPPQRDAPMVLEIQGQPMLNALEKEALEHAVSKELWQSEGWLEDASGRVLRDLGGGRTRTVFKPGFVGAIRKLVR